VTVGSSRLCTETVRSPKLADDGAGSDDGNPSAWSLFNSPPFTGGMMEPTVGVSICHVGDWRLFALQKAIVLVLKPKNIGRTRWLHYPAAEARAIATCHRANPFRGFFIGVLPGAGGDDRFVLGLRRRSANIARQNTSTALSKGPSKVFCCTRNRQQRARVPDVRCPQLPYA